MTSGSIDESPRVQAAASGGWKVPLAAMDTKLLATWKGLGELLRIGRSPKLSNEAGAQLPPQHSIQCHRFLLECSTPTLCCGLHGGRRHVSQQRPWSTAVLLRLGIRRGHVRLWV